MSIAALAGRLLIVAFLGKGVGLSESFDTPLHKRVLDLGRSQYLMRSDNRHLTVTCWYYSHFMIKEKNDPGMKGAELLGLAPVRPGRLPKCSPTLQPDEKEFREWNSEFKTFASWNRSLEHNLQYPQFVISCARDERAPGIHNPVHIAYRGEETA